MLVVQAVYLHDVLGDRDLRGTFQSSALTIACVGARPEHSRRAAAAGMDKFAILPHLLALSVGLCAGYSDCLGPREKLAQRRSAHVSAGRVGRLRLCPGRQGFAADDPGAMARVIEGLITGVGFIGGGAIIKHGSSVRGTATAASLGRPARSAPRPGSAITTSPILISVFTFRDVRLFRLSRETSGRPRRPAENKGNL